MRHEETIGFVKLSGSCVGCRRFTWLCRQDRRCSRFGTKPKGEYAIGVLKRAGVALDAMESGAHRPTTVCQNTADTKVGDE